MQNVTHSRMTTYSFPVDHFGIVSSALISTIQNQSDNKGARATAVKKLIQLAKIVNQVPKGADIAFIAVTVDIKGNQFLEFVVKVPLILEAVELP